jgi:hypothetical protein
MAVGPPRRPPDTAVPRTGERAEQWVWALALVAALPALVAGAAAVGAAWVPDADLAPIEVRVRDAWSTNPPLVGAYSRVGGNHPGPAMFYALALPYRLLGAQPWALLTGAALINATMIVLAVRIAGRKRRTGLAALTAVAILALSWSLGPDGLRSPWNPNLALLPFLTAALATWAVVTGSRRSLPVAAVTISFCAQTHVGYLPLAVVLAAWCVVGLVRQRHQLDAWRVAGLVTAAALVAMWLPVLGQQLFGDNGNLTRILGEAGGSDDATFGLDGVRGLLLPHLGPWPRWPRPTLWNVSGVNPALGWGWPPIGLAVFVAAVVVAGRRRDRDAGTLLAVTASLWVAGAFAISRLSGLSGSYLYRWVRVLGLLLWVAALWTLGRALLARAPRIPLARERTGTLLVAGAALTVLAVAAAFPTIGAPFADKQSDSLDRQRRIGLVAEATEQAVAERLPTGSTIEVRPENATHIAPATVAQLERAGHHVLVDQREGTVWGRHRRPQGRARDALVIITTEDGRAADDTSEALEVVATIDQLTPEEGREHEAVGPPSPRCREILFAAKAWGDSSDEASRDACQRRADLASRDRHATILIGP